MILVDGVGASVPHKFHELTVVMSNQRIRRNIIVPQIGRGSSDLIRLTYGKQKKRKEKQSKEKCQYYHKLICGAAKSYLTFETCVPKPR